MCKLPAAVKPVDASSLVAIAEKDVQTTGASAAAQLAEHLANLSLKSESPSSTECDSSSVEAKNEDQKRDSETDDDDREIHCVESKEEDDGKDDEDTELENLLAKDWQGKHPAAPLLRRQKRRQRQRANAKVGRAIRRFVASKGHRLSTYHQLLVDHAQREIVAYLDYAFGPYNLPTDTYLNTHILDPIYKSATVASVVSFEGVQCALSPLGDIEPELQHAIVVDSLRWSSCLRCGPVCYPDGEIVFCFRVRNVQQRPMFADQLPTPAVALSPFWLCVCGNCSQMIDARFGYCGICGAVFK